MNSRTLQLLVFFMRLFPRRSAGMVLLLILSGLAEGVGLATLLPILELAADSSGSASDLSTWIARGLATVGLAPTLFTLLCLLVGGITLKALFLWVAMRQVGYTMAHVSARLRNMLVERLLRARWRHFMARQKGQIANTLGWEVQAASATYREACTVLAIVFQIMIYVAVSFAVSWQITISALLAGAVVWLALRSLVGMSRKAGQKAADSWRSMAARVVDTLGGLKPVKAMARERLLLPLLQLDIRRMAEAQQQQVFAMETMRLFQEPLLGFILAGGLFVTLTYSELPFSTVLVMAMLFYRIMQNMNAIQIRFQTIANGEAAFESLQSEIADAEREREPSNGRVVPPALSDAIQLRDISFAYREGADVLAGVSLDIPAGRFVAIAGPSGSGKTTIADLLLGLHCPQRGEVYIDGVPLSEIDLSKWRRQIGYVPQEPWMLNGSVLYNITLGDSEISREDVEWALREADAWEFVSQRPLGVDEAMGEAGAHLSGGQRQRIAIARALVHRPRLLLLDEATTALNPEAERSICDTIRGLRGRVTILAISHQPAMQEVADIVYTLKDGQIYRPIQTPHMRVSDPVVAAS